MARSPPSRTWGAAQAAAGQRVLFAGCGTGSDATAAARRGARVTAIDASPHRLARARGLDDQSSVEWTCADVLGHDRPGCYDVIVAPFFLNGFGSGQLPCITAHLKRLLRPAGRLVVGDFAAAPRTLQGSVQRLYHNLPMWVFALLAGSARHPIHDLASALSAAGFRIEFRQSFRVFRIGPAWIEGLVAVNGGST